MPCKLSNSSSSNSISSNSSTSRSTGESSPSTSPPPYSTNIIQKPRLMKKLLHGTSQVDSASHQEGSMCKENTISDSNCNVFELMNNSSTNKGLCTTCSTDFNSVSSSLGSTKILPNSVPNNATCSQLTVCWKRVPSPHGGTSSFQEKKSQSYLEMARVRKHRIISEKEMIQVLHLSQQQACKLLGCSLSTLKRRFYELKDILGLKRWPQYFQDIRHLPIFNRLYPMSMQFIMNECASASSSDECLPFPHSTLSPCENSIIIGRSENICI